MNYFRKVFRVWKSRSDVFRFGGGSRRRVGFFTEVLRLVIVHRSVSRIDAWRCISWSRALKIQVGR